MNRLLKNKLTYFLSIYFVLIFLGISNIQAQKLGTGFLSTPPEELARYEKVPAYRDALEPSIDLSKRFPRPDSQGQQGSCVAWAVAYAAASYYENNSPQRTTNNFRGSPSYIYNQLTTDRTCNSGLYIGSALNVYKHEGIASLSEFPYNQNQCSLIPDANIKSKAFLHRIHNFKTITDRKLTTIQGEIQKGHPVIFGMMISPAFSNYWNNKSTFREGPIRENSGHAMVIVGYDDSRQAFKVLNSWGRDFADNGFVWIDYTTFFTHLQDAWVIDPGFDVPPGNMVIEDPNPNRTKLDVITNIIIPPKPDPEPIDKASIQAAINPLISSLNCGKVTYSIQDNGFVRLNGTVKSLRDIEGLKKSISRIPGVSGIQSSVGIVAWPICEVNQTLDLFKIAPSGLKISIPDHPDGKLKGGDKFNIVVSTPAKKGHLYLTYLQAQGPSVDLLFNQTAPPNSVFEIGQESKTRPAKGKEYFFGKVDALVTDKPYGSEMIVGILSPVSLFDDEPVSRNDRDFLSKLRIALYKLSPDVRSQVVINSLKVETSAN